MEVWGSRVMAGRLHAIRSQLLDVYTPVAGTVE